MAVGNTVWKLEQRQDSQKYGVEAGRVVGRLERSGLQRDGQKYSVEAGTEAGQSEI